MRGRPTDYKPEYCQMLIDHMAEGFSFESFAAVVKVNRDTLYNWVSIHPDFSDAKKAGFEESRLTWEQIGRDIAKKGEGNATAFIFNMKNRFREDWNDKQTIEHQGAKVNVSIEPDAGCEPIKD